MKTTVNFFRTLLLSVLTLTFGACGEDSLLSELGLDGQTSTKVDGAGEVWDGSVAESFAGGSGTAEAPYQIANGAQLAKLAQDVNGGNNYAGTYFVLTADILLNDTEGWENWNESTEGLNRWTPIGNNSQPFTGTLDGDGHSVSGIYINSEADNQGLVGYLGSGGALQNLGVKASYIKGGYSVGGLCGDNNRGTVKNCYNTGSVAGTGYEAGGLCGYNDGGTVTNCYNTGKVTGNNSVGGVCGWNDMGSITNCYNTGKVTGRNDAGGVCGYNDGNVTNCYYLTGTANSGIGEDYNSGEATEKTAEQFQSGEVAYLLSTGENGEIWGQNLTLAPKDSYPVLGGLKVVQNGDGSYANELKQDGDFYLISTADELRLFASMVNGGNPGISAKLTADIELNNTTGWENWDESNAPANSWTPIGTKRYFAGTFDGQGHTISGLYIIGSDYSIYNAGLFGGLEGGTVENVGVTKSYIQGSDYTGGIVGFMYGGTIRNCYCTGIVRCQGYGGGGGIAGMSYNNSTIANCYFAGSIISEYGSAEMIGPIVGGMYAEEVNPTNCYYLNTCGATGAGTSKTAEQFQGGEVAWLLGEGWGQTIGTDDSPVLTTDASKKVYALDLYNGTPDKQQSYANIGTSFLPEGSNAIALVDADSPFKTGTNIVVKDGDSYTCDNLVLTDDADFYTPVKFTATNATYTRTPSVWATNGGSGSGWETICLPFSGTLYAGGDAKQPVDVASNNGAYWLRSLTGFETPNTLIFASPATAADNQIEAGVPYIIALPGNTFGSESLEGQTISVRGTNVAVTNVAQSVQPEGSLFAFTGTFATNACNAASYRLNSENGSNGAGNLFVLDTELTDLAPFRCRIDVTGLNIGGASTRSASGLPKELRIGQ